MFPLDLSGVIKTHLPRVVNMKLGDIEYIYSGGKDGAHRRVVELMMNKEASKPCLGWEVLIIEF